MTRLDAARLAKRLSDKGFTCYIMDLCGIEDLDSTHRYITQDKPYDVVTEEGFDYLDMTPDQISVRTLEVVG